MMQHTSPMQLGRLAASSSVDSLLRQLTPAQRALLNITVFQVRSLGREVAPALVARPV